LPLDTVPVDIYNNPESIIFKFTPTTDRLSIPPPKDKTCWKQEILKHLQIFDMTQFYTDLGNKDIAINIVSDDGVHNYHSNFGLVVATKPRIVAKNKGQIYGVEFHESSYRSELYGMLAAIVSFNHILEAHKIEIPREKQVNIY
jgi:hypothetical protein